MNHLFNASFTDIQQKRKGDVCSSLGRHFNNFHSQTPLSNTCLMSQQ